MLRKIFGEDLPPALSLLHLPLRLVFSIAVRKQANKYETLAPTPLVSVIREDFNYKFNPRNIDPKSRLNFYVGGWHSERYFPAVLNELRVTYKFPEPSDLVNMRTLTELSGCESVAVHVRRGDYLNPENRPRFAGVCGPDYYTSAIRLLETKLPHPKFYVFSDDIAWVKKTLAIPKATYVCHNALDDSWRDMHLMSTCKHQIIANSTFSWWAAWLNPNPEKIVICPNRFTSDVDSVDIFPEAWIRI
jgi:hypothetical protein